jgi:predicted alpha/beta superfamily hydrolase
LSPVDNNFDGRRILKILIAGICGLLFFSALIAQAHAGEPVVIGERTSIHSEVLNEERPLLVRLPESYQSAGDRRYPVIFALDGETHFHLLTGVVDWLSQRSTQIPEVIVVGIPNVDRVRDLAPSVDPENGRGGGADDFLQFLSDELIPHIDKHYRTRPYRILTGHSLAGLFTLHTLIREPSLFQGYIAMSPWLARGAPEPELLERATVFFRQRESLPVFLYTTVGDEPALKPHYDSFIGLLGDAPKDLDWHSDIYPADNHMSVVSRSLNNALQKLFADTRIDPESDLAKKGADAIRAHFRGLSKEKYGYPLSPEAAINRLGYHALGQEEPERALTFFRANAEAFPDSANAYDSLADALLANDQLEAAVAALETAARKGREQKHPSLEYYERHLQQVKVRLAARQQ